MTTASNRRRTWNGRSACAWAKDDNIAPQLMEQLAREARQDNTAGPRSARHAQKRLSDKGRRFPAAPVHAHGLPQRLCSHMPSCKHQKKKKKKQGPEMTEIRIGRKAGGSGAKPG